MKPYFGQIIIQQKGVEDFRSFAHVRDTEGDWWELRGYGKTASDAAADAWKRVQDEDNWDVHGYAVQVTMDRLREAVIDLMDGQAAHDIQGQTGLPIERCRELCKLYQALVYETT